MLILTKEVKEKVKDLVIELVLICNDYFKRKVFSEQVLQSVRKLKEARRVRNTPKTPSTSKTHDENRWVTLNGRSRRDERGREREGGGTHVLLNENNEIVAGMNDKFTGKKISELSKSNKTSPQQTVAKNPQSAQEKAIMAKLKEQQSNIAKSNEKKQEVQE